MEFDDNNLYGKAYGLDQRGRHESFACALQAAMKDLVFPHDPFFDRVVDEWPKLFPNSPATPARYEDGYLYLYVPSASLLFATLPQVPAIKRKLRLFPEAPKKFEVRVEAHAR